MATCYDCIHTYACKYDRFFGDVDVNHKCMYFQRKADVAEVVRCNKCRHCEIVIDQFDNDWYFCKKTANNAEVKPNDFCSYGERRTDDDL